MLPEGRIKIDHWPCLVKGGGDSESAVFRWDSTLFSQKP